MAEIQTFECRPTLENVEELENVKINMKYSLNNELYVSTHKIGHVIFNVMVLNVMARWFGTLCLGDELCE